MQDAWQVTFYRWLEYISLVVTSAFGIIFGIQLMALASGVSDGLILAATVALVTVNTLLFLFKRKYAQL